MAEDDVVVLAVEPFLDRVLVLQEAFQKKILKALFTMPVRDPEHVEECIRLIQWHLLLKV